MEKQVESSPVTMGSLDRDEKGLTTTDTHETLSSSAEEPRSEKKWKKHLKKWWWIHLIFLLAGVLLVSLLL